MLIPTNSENHKHLCRSQCNECLIQIQVYPREGLLEERWTGHLPEVHKKRLPKPCHYRQDDAGCPPSRYCLAQGNRGSW